MTLLVVDLFIIGAGIGLFLLVRRLFAASREARRARALERENRRLEADRAVWVEAERARREDEIERARLR